MPSSGEWASASVTVPLKVKRAYGVPYSPADWYSSLLHDAAIPENPSSESSPDKRRVFMTFPLWRFRAGLFGAPLC